MKVIDKCEPVSMTLEAFTRQLFIVCRNPNAVIVVKLKPDGDLDYQGKILDSKEENVRIESVAVSHMAE